MSKLNKMCTLHEWISMKLTSSLTIYNWKREAQLWKRMHRSCQTKDSYKWCDLNTLKRQFHAVFAVTSLLRWHLIKPFQQNHYNLVVFQCSFFCKHFSVMLRAAILSTDGISRPPQFFMKINSDGLKLEIIA